MTNVITIGKQQFELPEGFKVVKNRFSGEEIYDETGRSCSLFYSGYTSKVGDDQPYITTLAVTGSRRIPLKKVEQSGN